MAPGPLLPQRWAALLTTTLGFARPLLLALARPPPRTAVGGRYSSGEDLTSEEHLGTAVTKRTIKRTLSSGSVASVHRAISSGSLSGSAKQEDLETLSYMFGDETGAGVGC